MNNKYWPSVPERCYPWTCDVCGSENVKQEYYSYHSMNEEDVEPALLSAGDFYWCEDCDEDCSPVRACSNPLHKDYQGEQ